MILVLAEFLLSCKMILVLPLGQWRLIGTEESFNDILASLDVRGNREAQLHSMLQRVEARFKDSVNKTRVDVTDVWSVGSSSPSDSLSTPNTSLSNQDFEKWMWRECLDLRLMKFENTRCQHLLKMSDNV